MDYKKEHSDSNEYNLLNVSFPRISQKLYKTATHPYNRRAMPISVSVNNINETKKHDENVNLINKHFYTAPFTRHSKLNKYEK